MTTRNATVFQKRCIAMRWRVGDSNPLPDDVALAFLMSLAGYVAGGHVVFVRSHASTAALAISNMAWLELPRSCIEAAEAPCHTCQCPTAKHCHCRRPAPEGRVHST